MNGSMEIPGRRIQRWSILIVLPLTVLILFLLAKVNMDFAARAPGGNDFLVHWVGARALLAGGSPYGEDTALEIQMRAYGRPALPGEHELRVAYPIFAEYLFVPFALLDDYPTARGIWMTLLELAALAFGALAWNLADRANSRGRRILFLFFSIFWYLNMRALVNGNAIILVGLFLALALWALGGHRDNLAGFFLAWTIIKPQVALLPLVFLAAWMVWQRRLRPMTSFLVTVAALVGTGLLMLPDWLAQNWSEVLRYPAYNPPSTPAAIGFALLGEGGRILGWMVTGMVILLLLIRWWRIRNADYAEMAGGLVWCIVLAPLAGIQTDTGNEILLLIPLAWLFAGRLRGEPKRIAAFVAGLGILLAGFWIAFLVSLGQGSQPQQNPALLFFLPIVLAVWMTWDEWRAARLRNAAAPRGERTIRRFSP
jgi:hypothetical protein